VNTRRLDMINHVQMRGTAIVSYTLDHALTHDEVRDLLLVTAAPSTMQAITKTLDVIRERVAAHDMEAARTYVDSGAFELDARKVSDDVARGIIAPYLTTVKLVLVAAKVGDATRLHVPRV
jgi:hypothetical protein